MSGSRTCSRMSFSASGRGRASADVARAGGSQTPLHVLVLRQERVERPGGGRLRARRARQPALLVRGAPSRAGPPGSAPSRAAPRRSPSLRSMRAPASSSIRLRAFARSLARSASASHPCARMLRVEVHEHVDQQVVSLVRLRHERRPLADARNGPAEGLGQAQRLLDSRPRGLQIAQRALGAGEMHEGHRLVDPIGRGLDAGKGLPKPVAGPGEIAPGEMGDADVGQDHGLAALVLARVQELPRELEVAQGGLRVAGREVGQAHVVQRESLEALVAGLAQEIEPERVLPQRLGHVNPVEKDVADRVERDAFFAAAPEGAEASEGVPQVRERPIRLSQAQIVDGSVLQDRRHADPVARGVREAHRVRVARDGLGELSQAAVSDRDVVQRLGLAAESPSAWYSASACSRYSRARRCSPTSECARPSFPSADASPRRSFSSRQSASASSARARAWRRSPSRESASLRRASVAASSRRSAISRQTPARSRTAPRPASTCRPTAGRGAGPPRPGGPPRRGACRRPPLRPSGARPRADTSRVRTPRCAVGSRRGRFRRATPRSKARAAPPGRPALSTSRSTAPSKERIRTAASRWFCSTSTRKNCPESRGISYTWISPEPSSRSTRTPGSRAVVACAGRARGAASGARTSAPQKIRAAGDIAVSPPFRPLPSFCRGERPSRVESTAGFCRSGKSARLREVIRRVDLDRAKVPDVDREHSLAAADELEKGGLVPLVDAALGDQPPFEHGDETPDEGRGEDREPDRFSRGAPGELFPDVLYPAVAVHGHLHLFLSQGAASAHGHAVGVRRVEEQTDESGVEENVGVEQQDRLVDPAQRQPERPGVVRGGILLVAPEIEPGRRKFGRERGAEPVPLEPVDDRDAGNPLRRQDRNGAGDDRAAADLEQTLRERVGQRPQALRRAGRQENGARNRHAPAHRIARRSAASVRNIQRFPGMRAAQK